MNGGSLIILVIGLMIASGIIVGVLIFIRGIHRFLDWKTGEKDELWNFLSLMIGGFALAFLGISSIPIFESGSSFLIYYAFAVPFGIILMLISVALTTIYLFLKWRASA